MCDVKILNVGLILIQINMMQSLVRVIPHLKSIIRKLNVDAITFYSFIW